MNTLNCFAEAAPESGQIMWPEGGPGRPLSEARRVAPPAPVGAALAALLVLSGTLRAELPTPRGERAVFAISTEVAVPAPPRFGVNFDPPAMTHWGEEPFHNQWWGHPNLNPIEARLKKLATGGRTGWRQAPGRRRCGEAPPVPRRARRGRR